MQRWTWPVSKTEGCQRIHRDPPAQTNIRPTPVGPVLSCGADHQLPPLSAQRWGLTNLTATNHRTKTGSLSAPLLLIAWMHPNKIRPSQTGPRCVSQGRKKAEGFNFLFQWGETISSWSTVCRKKFKYQGDGQQCKITRLQKLIVSGLFACLFEKKNI